MSTLELEPYNSEKYTAEQIETALTALAAAGGNSVTAAQRIPFDVPKRTLNAWRREQYPNRYQAACERVAHQLEDTLITQARAAAIAAGNLELDLLERLAEKAEGLDGRELAGAMKNVTLTKGINIDKVLTLTGRPTNVTEHRTVDQNVRKLQSLGIVDAEVIEEEPKTAAPMPVAASSNARGLPAPAENP